MDTRAQIPINIVLVICFAFAVLVAVDTNSRVEKINQMMDRFEEREQMYFERRMKAIETIERLMEEDMKSENVI